MATPKIERRFVSTELRIDSTGNGVIHGTAAVHYDGTKRTQSQNLGGFVERIRVGAFSNCLSKNPDVRVLFNHNPSLVLGRTASGTAKVWADLNGLHYSCNLPATRTAQELRESIQRGDINQCSFGFTCDDDDWDDDGEDEKGQRCLVRTLNNVSDLLDVSPVTYPAYQATACDARTLWPDGQPAGVEARMAVQQELAKFSHERTQRRNLMHRVLGM
jgi:uncharacterized protein